ncbi:hypothetical protein T484DRAFT_1831548 [Baffinella frigidus]|nr:hypothetical protein T484DRAFT_1831548 [Cryptophyta sp. CCMP2293]
MKSKHGIMLMKSKHGIMLVCWKMHNVVSADGIHRGEWDTAKLSPHEAHLHTSSCVVTREWDTTKLFPHEAHLHTSSFVVPSDEDKGQMSLNPCPDKGNTTHTCLSSDDGFEVLSDIQGRWQIEGGIDQPLVDRSPEQCEPPGENQKILKMDVYVMAKCAKSMEKIADTITCAKSMEKIADTITCAKSMEKIADTIKCDYSCEIDGETYEARLDFQLHMVGLNNGTYADPWLRAIHGPSVRPAL